MNSDEYHINESALNNRTPDTDWNKTDDAKQLPSPLEHLNVITLLAEIKYYKKIQINKNWHSQPNKEPITHHQKHAW